MKFLLILGMPRSGTSLVSEIVENMGFDFKLSQENSLDGLYINSTNKSFFQNRQIHLHLLNSGVKNFEIHTKPIDTHIFTCHEVIKEPYMVGILKQIKHLVSKVILVIRNPQDVIDSAKKFLTENNTPIQNNSLQDWKRYYLTFLELIEDTPYIVVNYDILLKYPLKTIDSLFTFFNLEKKHFDIDIKIKKESSLLNLDMISMALYKSFTENLNLNFKNLILDKKENICFCGSNRKFKRCCKNYSPKDYHQGE